MSPADAVYLSIVGVLAIIAGIVLFWKVGPYLLYEGHEDYWDSIFGYLSFPLGLASIFLGVIFILGSCRWLFHG
jgi:hypothetical protein